MTTSKRRSKLEILMDILFLIQKKERAKPTHILYEANLSYKSLNEHLDSLISNGLIKKVEKNKHTFYELTEKGYNSINEFRRIKRLTEAFGISV